MSNVDTSDEAVEREADAYDGPMPICAQNCGCSGVCRSRTAEACPCARTAALLRALAADRRALREALAETEALANRHRDDALDDRVVGEAARHESVAAIARAALEAPR